MCKCFKKNCVLSTGLFLTIAIGILSIACLILACIGYKYTIYNWSNWGPWRNLGRLEMATVIIVIGVTISGLFNFTWGSQCKTIQIFYVIFSLISFCLSFATSIMVLVGGALRANNLTNQCQGNLKGMFSNFMYLDSLMHITDEYLCSDKCKCPYFYNDSATDDFNEAKNKYNDYNIFLEQDDKILQNSFSIDNCSDGYSYIYGRYLEEEPDQPFFESAGDIKEFSKYFKNIEEKFHCNGWCDPIYSSEKDERSILIKFLFSDINLGVSQNKGCMKVFTKWLAKVVNAYGALMIIIAFLQGFQFSFALLLYLYCYKEGKNETTVYISDSKGQGVESNNNGEKPPIEMGNLSNQ